MWCTQRRVVTAVLGMLSLTALVQAEQGAPQPLPKPEVKRFDSYLRVDLQLADALGEGKAVAVHLGGDGAAGFPQAWAEVAGVKVVSDAVDASGLTLKDGRLSGTVEIAELRDGSDAGLACEFQIDATIEGGRIAGTCEGWTAVRVVDGKSIAYLGEGLVVRPDQVRWKRDQKQPVSGKLSGTVRDAAAAAEGQAIAKGASWPRHRGPNDDWSADAGGVGLIDDMHQARLVWKSETTPAARSQVTRYGEGNIVRFLERGLAGGGSSPMVADGRVYFHYFKPAGEACDEKTVAGQIAGDRHTILDMWKTHAVDVVLCLDAATGRTLWKAEIPGGRYYPAMSGRMGSTKGWYAPHPAVADGRVFVSTTSDVTYCLDAATGQMQWSKKTPMAAVRTVIDGVLLPSGPDLIGYDAATGNELWRIERANSSVRAPLRWRHEGKDYAIAGNKGGSIVCVEPKTGKPLWRLTGAGENEDALVLAGDILLVNVAPAKERGKPAETKRLGAYRLSLAKAEKAWELGEEHPYDAQNRPVVVRDGLALLRHGDKSGKAVVVKIDSGEVVKQLQFPAARGFLYRVGDRLILQRDASHSSTELFMHTFRPDELHQMGELWHTLHTPTSGYWPITISHAVADGRIFIRGARGIFCYDLRARGSAG